MRGGSDGSPWIRCTGNTLLAPTQATKNTVLAAVGDNYTIGYSTIRTLGATNVGIPNTVNVPDVSLFYVGMNVLVTSLDGQKSQGLFSISALDKSANTLTLSDSVIQPPSEFSCSLVGRGNSAIMFNVLQLRKFSIDAIGLVKYEVENMPEGKGSLHLMSRAWPAAGNTTDQLRQEVIPYFMSMKVAEQFIFTTASKGIYQSNFTISRYNTKVRGPAVPATLTASGGYTLTGVEIANVAAVPAPPSLDNLFVTCGLNGTPMLTDFVDLESTSPRPASYGKVISVYRIDVFYSESDVIDKSSPAISTSLASTVAPTCWSLKDVDCATHSLNGIPTVGPVNFLQIDTLPPSTPGRDHSCIDITNALVIPMFCTMPKDAQAVTKVHYTSATAGAQTANCSDTTFPGLSIQYSYDPTAPNLPSRCTQDGSIYIGRLVNAAADPPTTGPVLAVKDGGCSWSNGATSCNAFEVLSDDTTAKLKSVTLTPEDISIKDGSNVLTCD
jgi:hypothetical protein